MRSIDAPKSPVSRGRSGSFRLRFRALNPSAPVRKKASNASDFFFSSEMSNVDIKIRKSAIIEIEMFFVKGRFFDRKE